MITPPPLCPSLSMKDYTILEKIYTGYASTVYRARCKISGETVCLKVGQQPEFPMFCTLQ